MKQNAKHSKSNVNTTLNYLILLTINSLVNISLLSYTTSKGSFT